MVCVCEIGGGGGGGGALLAWFNHNPGMHK